MQMTGQCLGDWGLNTSLILTEILCFTDLYKFSTKIRFVYIFCSDQNKATITQKRS